MSQELSPSVTWNALSDELVSALEKAGRSVVAVHGRRRIPASGVHWRAGIVVTANHAIERNEEVDITLPDRSTAVATLAGRDPGTDLAILKMSAADLPLAELGDPASLKPGQLVLTAGRTAEGTARSGLAMIAVTGPAWRTWMGGSLDCTLRLDRNLHPNFSGGPLVDSQGRILGINTPALSRFAAVVIPASSVDRVAAELENKGHIGRGYLGLGMQPVSLPEKLRESLKLTSQSGLLAVSVEPDGPAEKAGVLLGDILLALDTKPLHDTGGVEGFLTSDKIAKPVKASIIRGGVLTEVIIIIGERLAPNWSAARPRGWGFRRGPGHLRDR